MPSICLLYLIMLRNKNDHTSYFEENTTKGLCFCWIETTDKFWYCFRFFSCTFHFKTALLPWTSIHTIIGFRGNKSTTEDRGFEVEYFWTSLKIRKERNLILKGKSAEILWQKKYFRAKSQKLKNYLSIDSCFNQFIVHYFWRIQTSSAVVKIHCQFVTCGVLWTFDF